MRNKIRYRDGVSDESYVYVVTVDKSTGEVSMKITSSIPVPESLNLKFKSFDDYQSFVRNML